MEEKEMAAVIAAAVLELNREEHAGFKTAEEQGGGARNIWKETARREAVRLRG